MNDAVRMPDFCGRKSPFHYVTALNTLAKMGIDPNRVDILAVGEYWNYRGEVIEQTPAPGTAIDENTRIRLEVGHTSAVDYMPYQFFYGFGSKPPGGSDWEMNARKLMAPFDASVIRANARMRFLSLVFNFGLISAEYLERFLDLYDLESDVQDGSTAELLFWVSLLPMFHSLAGNPEFLASVITTIFGYACEVKENIGMEREIPEHSRYAIGPAGGRLGFDSVIGRSFSECDTAYEVRIRDVKDGDLRAFLPGGEKMRKLKEIIEFCMPSNYDCVTSVLGERKAARIGADRINCYLGVSSYI